MSTDDQAKRALDDVTRALADVDLAPVEAVHRRRRRRAIERGAGGTLALVVVAAVAFAAMHSTPARARVAVASLPSNGHIVAVDASGSIFAVDTDGTTRRAAAWNGRPASCVRGRGPAQRRRRLPDDPRRTEPALTQRADV